MTGHAVNTPARRFPFRRMGATAEAELLPEALGGARVAGEAEGGIRGYRALAVSDLNGYPLHPSPGGQEPLLLTSAATALAWEISAAKIIFIHDYFGVDHDLVRDVVTNKIPQQS